MKIVNVDFGYHKPIIEVVQEMKKLALNGGFIARQRINTVLVLVSGDSDENIILQNYELAQSGERDELGNVKKEVGP